MKSPSQNEFLFVAPKIKPGLRPAVANTVLRRFIEKNTKMLAKRFGGRWRPTWVRGAMNELYLLCRRVSPVALVTTPPPPTPNEQMEADLAAYHKQEDL